MTEFMKKPCKHCPYLRTVKPFLTPERGEELAYITQNPYNTFDCHKTLDYNDEEIDEPSRVQNTKVCAGFLSLQHFENGETFYDDEGFIPDGNVYSEVYEMIDAYEETNN